MINPEKISPEGLVEIVYDVQRQVGFRFDFVDLFELIRYTIRKAELNGKDEDYVPVLFRNELEDFVMRKQINERRFNCVHDLSPKPVPSQVS